MNLSSPSSMKLRLLPLQINDLQLADYCGNLSCGIAKGISSASTASPYSQESVQSGVSRQSSCSSAFSSVALARDSPPCRRRTVPHLAPLQSPLGRLQHGQERRRTKVSFPHRLRKIVSCAAPHAAPCNRKQGQTRCSPNGSSLQESPSSHMIGFSQRNCKTEAEELRRSSSEALIRPCREASVDDIASKATQEPIAVIKKWRCGSRIGQGAYGSVYKGLEVTTGMVFAIKKALITGCNDDHTYAENLRSELEIFQHVRHSNIVSFLGYELHEGSLCVFMEYVPGGSLSTMIREFGPLDGKLLLLALRGMLQGLDHLHTRNPPIIHRDIKGANVLVSDDFCVKLSDFGCSKRCDASTSFRTIGSVPWMAPEVLIQKDGYGRKADIWSLGCTIIELATGEMPWGNNYHNFMALLMHIATSQEPPEIPECLPEALRELVRSCVIRNAKKRPSASEILRSDVLTSK